MTLASARALLDAAVARGGAVPAFNVIALEHAEAIAAGAEQAGSPGILLQFSQNAVRFHGGDARPLLLAARAVAEASSAPLALHLDHFDDLELLDPLLADAERLGISSLMIDVSTRPYDENVAVTRSVADRARASGLLVESELGAVGGKDGAHAPGVRTDPEEAAAFAASTGIDALAVAVGSSHAMTDRTAALDIELVARLAAAVPVPLVLHGSSGVPDDALVAAVAAGMRKINIGTALNVAGTAALRAALDASPDAVDPRPPLRAQRDAMAAVVARFATLLP